MKVKRGLGAMGSKQRFPHVSGAAGRFTLGGRVGVDRTSQPVHRVTGPHSAKPRVNNKGPDHNTGEYVL